VTRHAIGVLLAERLQLVLLAAKVLRRDIFGDRRVGDARRTVVILLAPGGALDPFLPRTALPIAIARTPEAAVAGFEAAVTVTTITGTAISTGPIPVPTRTILLPAIAVRTSAVTIRGRTTALTIRVRAIATRTVSPAIALEATRSIVLRRATTAIAAVAIAARTVAVTVIPRTVALTVSTRTVAFSLATGSRTRSGTRIPVRTIAAAMRPHVTTARAIRSVGTTLSVALRPVSVTIRPSTVAVAILCGAVAVALATWPRTEATTRVALVIPRRAVAVAIPARTISLVSRGTIPVRIARSGSPVAPGPVLTVPAWSIALVARPVSIATTIRRAVTRGSVSIGCPTTRVPRAAAIIGIAPRRGTPIIAPGRTVASAVGRVTPTIRSSASVTDRGVAVKGRAGGTAIAIARIALVSFSVVSHGPVPRLRRLRTVPLLDYEVVK